MRFGWLKAPRQSTDCFFERFLSMAFSSTHETHLVCNMINFVKEPSRFVEYFMNKYLMG